MTTLRPRRTKLTITNALGFKGVVLFYRIAVGQCPNINTMTSGSTNRDEDTDVETMP